jgi:hypothetical protein
MAVNDVHPLRAFRDYAPRLWGEAWSLVLATPLAVGLLLRENRYRLLTIYLVILSLWTFYSSGKYGASWNYFAELGLLSLVIIALGLRTAHSWRAILPLPLIALLAIHAWHGAFQGTAFREARELPTFDLDPYVELFRPAGPLLTTNERLAVHVGEPEVIDWVLVEHLARKELLDPTLLFRRIAEGHYEYVALERRATTGLEEFLYSVVAEGPYERIDTRADWMRMYVFARAGRAR